MSSVLFYQWTCPYCGFVNKRRSEPESPYYPNSEVTYCDLDEGGCDHMVVVVPTVTITAKVYKVLSDEEGK
jgi:hypothetical protein